MFNKLSSPFTKAPVVAVAEPASVSPQFKREVVMLYDRFARASSGGFIKSFKAAVGVLEEIELVNNFKLIMGIEHNCLAFSENIRDQAVNKLKARFEKHVEEAEKSIESLESTVRAVADAKNKVPKSVARLAEITAYLDGMIEGMNKLINMRRPMLSQLRLVDSFSKSFDEIQLDLVILSESAEDFIPALAAGKVKIYSFAPVTLAGVCEDSGKNLFIDSP
jgi:hypothetical protein